MQVVNIHDAKTNFSKLIEAVQRGEEIIIAKAGVPAARLVPIEAKPVLRVACAWLDEGPDTYP